VVKRWLVRVPGTVALCLLALVAPVAAASARAETRLGVTGGVNVASLLQTAEARARLGLVPIDDNSSHNLGIQILAGVTKRVGRP
jgi:hypothetical protein